MSFLALILCALCGCAHQPVNPGGAGLFELRVAFDSQPGKTVQEFSFTATQGVQFDVKTQDQAGNHYQIKGTLRHRTGETFTFGESAVVNHGPAGDSGGSIPDLELGKESAWYAYGGYVGGGVRWLLTKK